ncbi:hypothetical protein RAS1_35120 [Phycisphaerae bacterium RAS1]|nr:hypothetical protein RAS1_35120 [Phycisphaerae bacterium RAS1]
MANQRVNLQKRLRVGLIATPDLAAPLAEAVQAVERFELAAQAGVARGEALPHVEHFDDTRVMIAQASIDAVIVAAGTRVAVELAEVAAAKGLHVWRTPPLARTFAEAVEILKRQAPRPTAYRLSSWWESVSTPIVDAIARLDGFKPLFSEIQVASEGPTLQSWKASAVDAAGGTLAEAAYAMLETLVGLRGLPESVSGAVARSRRRPAAQGRETEDTAAAILRYQGGGVALVRSTWDIPPFAARTLHHGAECSVELTPDALRVLDAGGGEQVVTALPGHDWAEEMQRFSEACQAPPGNGARPDLEHHLCVLALIEAVYLSARTGHPESPRKFYEVQGRPEPPA